MTPIRLHCKEVQTSHREILEVAQREKPANSFCSSPPLPSSNYCLTATVWETPIWNLPDELSWIFDHRNNERWSQDCCFQHLHFGVTYYISIVIKTRKEFGPIHLLAFIISCFLGANLQSCKGYWQRKKQTKTFEDKNLKSKQMRKCIILSCIFFLKNKSILKNNLSGLFLE